MRQRGARGLRGGPVRIAGLLAAVFVASSAAGAAVDPQAAEAAPGRRTRPNFLIVITDDQREGLGVMPAVRRRIMKKGVRFPSAFATTPLCCPSRASIFSGRYAHNHGVVNNYSARNLNESTTLQYHLLQDGYRTGIVGKYLNKFDSVEHPHPSYFTDWAVFTGAVKFSYEGGRWNVNGHKRRPKMYSTTYVGERSMQFLRKWERQDDDQPWLLVAAPLAPHSPFTTLPKYVDAPVSDFSPAVEEDKSDKPPYVQASDATPETGIALRAAQYRSLMPLDDVMRQMLTGLNDLGETSDTVVIFVSDNGFLWSEHGLIRKGLPYTESVNVPMLMKWPRRIGAGSIDGRPVGNIDIAPTVLDAAGIEVESGPEMDGRSLLDTSWERNRIHLEYPSSIDNAGEWASTWTSTYQYTEYYGDDGLLDFREYYDLEADPLQMHNLLGDDDLTNDPLDAAALSAQLQNDRRCAGDECP